MRTHTQNITAIVERPGLITSLILSLLVITACNKTPSANFETDKSEYAKGETVKLTNKSENAKTYSWLFPDGQTSTSRHVNYILHSNTVAGVYEFKLEAFSKKGDKSATKIRNITVK